MKIELKGRNVQVTPELHEHVRRRFEKVARQVSSLAVLEVELSEEHTRAAEHRMRAEATLRLKGVTLRACDCSGDMKHAVHLCEEELSRQVKRHRDKRRHRREARAASMRSGISPAL
jgi:putative sigma-54 modulation protein